MNGSPLTGITALLGKINESGEDALPRLIPLVYDEMRRIAAHFIGKESSSHTWQATDLAHEAYRKLLKQDKMTYQNSAHFFIIVAGTMRRLLVDYARMKKAKKRGGGWQKINLDDAILLQDTALVADERADDGFMTDARSEEILQVNRALEKLATLKKRQYKIVELHFFFGFKFVTIAKILDVSKETVKRDWRFAKAWLLTEIKKGGLN